MAQESKSYRPFSELEGQSFELYLGTITYEVSLGNYMQFILSSGDSNELRAFLRGASNLQERLNILKREYEGQLIFINFSDESYRVFPDELRSSARESLSRLAVEINELQVTELEFIDGSVIGKARIVLKGRFRYVEVGAAVATILGLNFGDIIGIERDRIYDQTCIAFGNIENNGNGDININVDYIVEKPADMQTYFSRPARAEEDLAKEILKNLDATRPQRRPDPARPQPRPDNLGNN